MLSINSTVSVGLYGIALVIEDFTSSTSSVPLSSISLQFLLDIYNSNNGICPEKPSFVLDTPDQGSVINVPYTLSWNQQISAKSAVLNAR